MRRLTKSKDRKIFGVCGGIADFLHLDPTVVRLITLIVFAFSGFFPIGMVYLIAAMIMPNYQEPATIDGHFKVWRHREK